MARIKGIRLRMKAKRRSKLSAKKLLKKINRIRKSKLTNAPIPDLAPPPAPSPISEPMQVSSSASATDATEAPAQAMNNSDSIPGFIFLCNKKTKPRCFQYQVFGLPMGQKKIVEKIKPGTKLFLFDYGMRLLHGIYEAISEGKPKLEPKAFDGNFLAQVKFRIVKECLPIPEKYFKSAILENYHAGRLKLELSEQQVNTLVSLFRPLSSSSSSSSELADLTLPNATSSQPLLPLRMSDQYHKNLSSLHSVQIVDPQPIQPVQIMQHQQPTTGAFVDHVHPSFQDQNIPNPIDLYNAGSQELYSTRGDTLVVQEPYPRYTSEQEWLPQNHTTSLGNNYHPGPLMREPLQPRHCPRQQEIDAWYHHQLPFLRENALNGESFAAYTSGASNHNIFPTMQPHAPTYGSPELPYLVSGPHLSSTVQPLPPAFGRHEQTNLLSTDPYFSSTMQPHAPDGRPQPNYPWPCVSTAMQTYVPASAWPEENYPLPAASYASSVTLPYAQASGWCEPNHPLSTTPLVTMQSHATSSGIPVPNVPMTSPFSFVGANRFIY